MLKLAHDIPMVGHLGRERTLTHVQRQFWWPGVAQDVAEYCRTCSECQKTAKRPPKVPLIPMPIMWELFHRIATDIVGPLPKTSSGCQYILVICDYAMCYPEGYPLRSITADKVD